MAKVKKETGLPANIIINDITQVAPDRNRKDVAALKSAIQRAESINLPSPVQLFDLYHDITTIDGYLAGIIQKRIDAVLNKTVKFVDKEGRKVDAMDKLIDSRKFARFVELVIESDLWGLSSVQFIVGKEFDFVEIPRKHVRIDRRQIVRSQYDSEGIFYGDDKFIRVIGEKGNLGKLLQCAMYALYKRGGIGDLAQYVEIFGQPVRIIYYDAYDTKTKQELRNILTTSGGSLAMMIPKQAEFQMMDGKSSNGTGELQERFITICNQEMAIRVLGNTETTSSSTSSGYAQAKEHGKQQLEITKSDIKFVTTLLNEPWFLEVLRSYGYPVEGGRFEFEKELDLDALKLRLEIDAQVSSKVPVDDDYWYDTYGIPKPDNYDELKTKMEEQRNALAEAYGRVAQNDESDNDESEKKPTEKKKNKNLLDRVQGFFFPAPLKGRNPLDF